LNLASIAPFIGFEIEGASTFAYCITKAGALQLAESLTRRYGAAAKPAVEIQSWTGNNHKTDRASGPSAQ
jgi:hypothetical protein